MSDTRYMLMLIGFVAAGLGLFHLAVPGRADLLVSAAAGAFFAAAISIAGFEMIRRGSRRSAEHGVRTFLAVMTVKVLAFAAFLLTIALTTSLNPAALASGLAGVTLLGEALAIEGFLRMRSEAGSPGAPVKSGEHRESD